MRFPRALLVTLALFAIVATLTVVRYGPPRAEPLDAPAGTFSGERARAVLAKLVGDGAAHPTGSEANRRIRERIVAELRRLGYSPELQPAFSCGKYGSCAFLTNVVARLPGTEPGASVLVSAHYDSVAAGPGANDDGSGVASILEIARAMKESPPLRHPVVFLFDEAEESGLNGAEAFAHQHPFMRDVRATVNLDARGSEGPSILFETSPNNAWIVGLAASALPRPVTSSLYYAVYRRMPNDTDFTVLGRTSHGANFAYTGSLEHYHTPLDRLQNTHAGVLQHQGENALGMARAFASTDLDAPRSGDAVWFDVLACFIVRWDERRTVSFAAIALGLSIVAAATRLRTRHLSASALAVGFVAMPLAVVAAALGAFAVAAVVRAAGGLPSPWVATSAPLLAALYLAATSPAALVAIAAARLSSREGLRLGTWLAWALVGLVLAWKVPGVSFLFVVPALVACVAAFPGAYGFGPAGIAIVAVVAAVLWIPLIWLLYPGIGMAAPSLHGALVGALLTTVAPLFAILGAGARKRTCAAACAGAIGFAAIAMFRAPFTPEHPERLNVVFQQDADSHTARTIVDPTWGAFTWGTVPDAMRTALGPGAREDRRFPWSSPEVVANDAPYLDVPAPELARSAERPSAGRAVRATLRSPRGAPTVVIVFPPSSGVQIVRAHGLPMTTARPLPAAGWSYSAFFAVPPQGVDLELAVEPNPAELTIFDQTSGAAPASQPVVAARPSYAVPTQDGDCTVVVRRVRL